MKKKIDFLKVRIELEKELPQLEKPVFVQGLGGLGNVGMLAATHLIRELDAIKLANVYSPYFVRATSPLPGIMYADGVVELLKDEIYYDPEESLMIFVGPYQGSTLESYYMFAEVILDFCAKCGVRRVFTLGGYGTGRHVAEPKVYGVATDARLVEEIKKHGVHVERGYHGPITGMAGLLLGLGKERGFEGVCLLGETHGEYPDPKAAKAVFKALTSILGIKASTDALDKEIKIIEEEIRRMAEQERRGEQRPTFMPFDDRYVGYV